MDNQTEKRCGYVAILGRPNVGKSSLLNYLLGKKLSITSDKPQTTRHQILGVKTKQDVQAIYVDTPGIHQHEKKVMNRMMNRAASSVISDVDLIVFMLDARYWTEEDQWVAKKLSTISVPLIIALNKTDLVKDKTTMFPLLEKLSELFPKAELIPTSVFKKTNLDVLEQKIFASLPEQDHIFPPEQVTDRSDAFQISEIIREKIMRGSGQEVPYETAVTVERMFEEEGVLHIESIIWVEREGQKKILIGKSGERLKEIGQKARIDLEKRFGKKVYLNLWIKVKKGWSDSEKSLRTLGY